MKKVIYSLGALTALMMGACSDDNLQEVNTNDVADKDQICYVKVAISTQGMQGRADRTDTEFTNDYDYDATKNPNYEYGTSQESAINNIVFVFYDANGNQVGEKTTMPIEGFELTKNFDSTTGNIGDYYTSTVPVTILKGQSKPTQIMAFVNPVQTTGLDADLKSIMTVTRDDIKTTIKGADGKETTYYTMSNSVYYNPTATSGTGICRAAQIPEGGAYTTKEDAAKKGALSTTINVERYAAKVRLRTSDGMTPVDITPDNSATSANDGSESTAKFTLKFIPGKWALNAIDDLTFVTKVYLEDEVGSYGANAYTYSKLNSILNPGGSSWQWNSFENKRSYWALSPSYYKGVYPEVASDWTSQNYDVDYITYNTLTSLSGGKEPGGVIYAKETTVGTKGFNSNNPEASIPSVVYGGYYNVVNDKGENVMNGTNPVTFYIHTIAGKNNLYFEPNADGSSSIPGGTSVMQDIVNHQGTLFVTTTVTNRDSEKVTSTSTDPLSNSNLAQVANFLEIAHPSKEVLTNADGTMVKVPSRKVTIQIKQLSAGNTYTNVVNSENGETTTTYQLCFGNGSSIEDVTTSNYIAANKTLTTAALYVDKYNQGAAYFNIPVLHLGWYRAGNANWSDNNTKGLAKNIDWSKVRVGDFGIVRNHVYDILVNSITGLGVGIGNPDDPIIPENNGTTYYVNFTLNVLNWTVVPTQTMDL